MKNKYTAAILAFLLGYFGIHRFYLGQIGYGILYILLAFTGITTILCIFDIIIFLTISDRNFNLKYNY